MASSILHIGQSWRYRLWWLLPTAAAAGILEVLGWSARLWSSQNAALGEPYKIQISCTIIAPTPLVAANFIILGRIIKELGTSYSRLTPEMYAIVFCVFDTISLIVQAIGGASASAAFSNNQDPTKGGNIMLGGIAFQMGTITVYVICASEFYFRYIKDSPIRGKGTGRGLLTRPIKIMTAALIFNTTCLFIRAVYRVIELADGWGGRIISTQVYFNVLDGAMIVLAIYTLNIIHPGRVLYQRGSEKSVIADKEAQGGTSSRVSPSLEERTL